MVEILNCYLYAKKSYGTLSNSAIFLANPVYARFLRCAYVNLQCFCTAQSRGTLKLRLLRDSVRKSIVCQ